MSLLIKNGRVITATDDYVADIFIEGEKVNEIGNNLLLKADKDIDASGKRQCAGDLQHSVANIGDNIVMADGLRRLELAEVEHRFGELDSRSIGIWRGRGCGWR